MVACPELNDDNMPTGELISVMIVEIGTSGLINQMVS